jgi:exodeoxyribonuclease V beta subunit
LPANLDEQSNSQDEASKENVRLMYVALTRAKHAIWLGFSRLNLNGKGPCVTHQSALGAMMTLGEPVLEEEPWVDLLQSNFAQLGMRLTPLNGHDHDEVHEWLDSGLEETELKGPLVFSGQVDRDFRFSSFSSIMRRQGFDGERASADLPFASR